MPGYLQEKREIIPGNETNSPTYGTKIMYPVVTDWTPTPGSNPMERNDELRQSGEPQAVIEEHHEPSWSSGGRMYPDHIGWRLCHILGLPTTTAGDGVITDPDAVVLPVGTFRHVWKSTDATWGGSALTPPTNQMYGVYKDQSVFYLVKGAACESLAFNSQPTGGLTLTASGPALFANPSASDPSATPTFESAAIKPFMWAGLTLPTWLASTGTHDDFGISIAAPVERVFSMGAGSKFADLMERGDGPLVVSGSTSTRDMTVADLAALKSSTGFAMKAKWLSDSVIGATSVKHAMWLEGANAQYTTGTPAALANTRHIGSTFDFTLTTAGSGVASTITVVNSTTSYA